MPLPAAAGSSLAPIHNLPNEILAEIFLTHAAETRIFLGSSGYPHRQHPRYSSSSGIWRRLMRVCRHWRDVALATPTLWQLVDIEDTTTYLKLAIDRSCNAPLELYFHQHYVALHSIPLIVTQAHRLRKLLLPRFERSDSPTLNILFQTSMPLLNELRVDVNIGKTETVPTRISIDSLHTCFPSLRLLHLENFVVPWALPALSRMRRLTLRNCVALNGDLTFDQFLDTLEACTELEDLRLHRFVSTIVHRVPAGFARTVFLPRLRRLSISEPPALCRQLLSVLHLSPTLNLRVIGVLDLTLNLVDAHSIFPSMLPEDLSKLPIIPSLKHAHVKYDNHVMLQLWPTLNFPDERGSSGSITLKLDSELYMDFYMPRAIEDFVHLFSSAPLERVYVSCPRRSVEDRATWELLFAALPAVHTLTVLPGVTLQPVWDGLAGRRMPTLEVNEDAARAPSPLLLPHLRTLRMEGLEWSEYALAYVLDRMRRRARRGLPKLDELNVNFIGTSFAMVDDQEREQVERAQLFFDENMAEFAQSFVWGFGRGA